MKRIISVCALTLMVLLVGACGRTDPDAPQRPEPPQILPGDVSGDLPRDAQAGGRPVLAASRGVRMPEVRPGLEGIPIVWGYNPMHYGDARNLVQILEHQPPVEYASTIGYVLSNWFDVQLTGMPVADIRMAQDISPRPDIFLAAPYEARSWGLTRTIPKDMIRRYAPNYAALLDDFDAWGISRADNGEQTAINTYDFAMDYLNVFSVYRLDWLEEMGIALPGPVTQIEEGVYFSEDSYTRDEFMQIIDAFSRAKDNPVREVPPIWSMVAAAEQAHSRTWAMEISVGEDVLLSVGPILGMFGVNTGIMEEDGRAMPFYATQAYKEALLFLEEIAERDAIFFHRFEGAQRAFMCPFVQIGWAPVNMQSLQSVIREARGQDPDKRFLITPPEDGGRGRRGVSQARIPFNYNNGVAWVVGSHVDDDTLSRILNMIDQISFSPELATLTFVGFHEGSVFYDPQYCAGLGPGGVNERILFAWAGEPYDSRTLFYRHERDVRWHEGLFFTGIRYTNWDRVFYGPLYDAVTRYALSDAGTALILRPARQDIARAFADERAVLDHKYGEILLGATERTIAIDALNALHGIRPTHNRGLVHQYMLSILDGSVRVAESWDSYMEDLYANGLQAHIDLYAKFSR